MTAAALAHELDLPLLTIHLDGLLSKFLGETSAKLRVLFEAASNTRAVYLFDEVDALAGDRAGNDVGEARRILNSLLVLLETARPESLIIAATNHRSILDPALFRRFDLVLEYDLPTAAEAIAVLQRRLAGMAQRVDWKKIRDDVGGLSHAELVKAAEAAAKRTLLADALEVTTTRLREALSERGGVESD